MCLGFEPGAPGDEELKAQTSPLCHLTSPLSHIFKRVPKTRQLLERKASVLNIKNRQVLLYKGHFYFLNPHSHPCDCYGVTNAYGSLPTTSVTRLGDFSMSLANICPNLLHCVKVSKSFSSKIILGNF